MSGNVFISTERVHFKDPDYVFYFDYVTWIRVTVFVFFFLTATVVITDSKLVCWG